MSLRARFAKALDAMTGSRSTIAFLNARLGEYGTVLDLQIDPTSKRITIKAQLKGEHEAITVEVGRYTVIRDGDQAKIQIDEASCSREWLHALMQRLVVGKTFDAPSDVLDFIDAFLG